MTKLTARTIVDVSSALISLGEKELKRQPLVLKLSRLRRTFVTEAREIEERRRAIEQQYMMIADDGILRDDTGNVRLTNPYEYNKKVRELFDTEIAMEFSPVAISEFGEKFPWSANVLDPLLFAGVVTAPEDEKKSDGKHEEDSALAEPGKVHTADEG